jgi:LPS sulfotransferase NodH
MNVVQTIKQHLRKTAVTRSLLDAVETIRHPFALTQQVVMLHTGRCGSTLLADMLNQHPDIYWAGEIFARMTERHREVTPGPNALNTIVNKSRGEGRYTGKTFYGFELKYLPQQHLKPEFLALSLEDALLRLRCMRFAKFIVLRRDNYLRQAISVQIGRHQRRWHAKATPTEPTRIALNLESVLAAGSRRITLLEQFRSLEENHAKLERLLSADEALYLSYEDDILSDPMTAYRKCCEFLRVPPASPKIALARTNPFPYDAMVDNMPAVRALLRDTKYGWMLDA